MVPGPPSGERADPGLPEPPLRALAWEGDWRAGALSILDQTRLPAEEVLLRREAASDVVEDIRRLAVRGAPLLGVAAAYALVLVAREEAAGSPTGWRRRLLARAREVAGARPTAVNLGAAVARALDRIPAGADASRAARSLLAAARETERYEVEASAAIARHGAVRLGDARRVLTHCNAGALAAPGLGTALAPLYLLHGRGVPLHVWVDETRPLLQGLRLTAYELRRAGVPHRVIPDGAAADLIRRGRVDAVLVGADRVCANGDVVNKVGTLPLAVAARAHDVPFLVAAPRSTLDPATARGDDVPIEERPEDLVRYLAAGTAEEGLSAHAPAFDVTPAALVSALVTDAGVVEGPDAKRLADLRARAGPALHSGEGRGR